LFILLYYCILLYKNKLQYWARTEPGANSKVDYVIHKNGNIISAEVKAVEKGSLQSLHYLLDYNPHINQAIFYSKGQAREMAKIKFVPL
jgi:hypothetical protein